jgi:uncharacterized protein YciI
MDFLVIMRMRDPTDPETQRRRDEARPRHLEHAAKLQNQGHLLIGGAIFLEDGVTSAGSAAVARFERREAPEAWLRDDPYTRAGVWQQFEIIPYRVAPHYLHFQAPGGTS